MYERSSSSLTMAKSYSTRSSTKLVDPEQPSIANLRFKLTRVISHHQQLKVSFIHLKSKIKSGLLETEEVFASLAVPLTKLVGLKTGEMAEQGRFSTIVIDKEDKVEATRTVESQNAPDRSYKEDSYVSKATIAGKEILQKQKMQILQLVRLLKQIETQVNSSHNNICEIISDHRDSTQIYFQKVMAFLASIHQAGAGFSHDTMAITVKVLHSTFGRVNSAFDSIEDGVEDLMCNLGGRMCAPMMGYVKSLKAEMTAGHFQNVLATVEKLGGELRTRQLELEQERRNARESEERKLEALSMLNKSEASIKKMKEYLKSFSEAKRGRLEYSSPPMLKGADQAQAKDEGLLWELVCKKRKYQISESPIGPQELNCIGFNTHKSKRVRPQITSRPLSRNHAAGLNPKTPCSDSRLVLGSSPSVQLRRF